MAEKGTRRRPTARQAESLAELARLAHLYDCGRYAEAIALAESMLETSSSSDLRARTRVHLAMSQLQLARPALATEPLAAAREHFEAAGDSEMLVECAAAEASLAFLEQRPDALPLAMRALSACRALADVPSALELRILNGVATAQWLVGQRREAIQTFEEAIARADPVVDMRRLGKLLDSAATAYSEVGQIEKAAGFNRRAVALFETLRDVVCLARAENNLGWSLVQLGDLTSARQHLERSLELHDQIDLQQGRSALLCSLCELCVAEGNLEQAKTYADAAMDVAESQSEAWSIAEARLWRGRVAARMGDHAAVDGEFQSALAVLRDSGMAARLVDFHVAYAEALEDRGDLTRAYAHLKAAAGIFDVKGR